MSVLKSLGSFLTISGDANKIVPAFVLFMVSPFSSLAASPKSVILT